MKSDFTHLHVHSHYSLLNALPKVPDLISRAKELKMKSLAITDNGNLYGAIEFYDKCKQNDIKPIIGVDFYVAPRTRLDKESRVDNRTSRLVLLAKNNKGYKNLIKLVSAGYLEGFYYKPRVDKELLEKYSSDLICISPSFSGEVANHLRNKENEKAKELADFYKKIYGAENVYLEISHHPEIKGFAELNEDIKKFSETESIPLVATQDIYYLKPDDKEARKTLLSIQSSFGGGSYFNRDTADFSFIDQKQISEFFKDIPESISNTEKIADQCNVEIELGKWKFPDYKIESGLSPDAELRRMTFEGIPFRDMTESKEVLERIEYELEIISTKGYSKYFLAVADILKAARDRGIFTNTRGSAAGSLVSYLLGITIVNPLEFNLPFERFLNPERPSAPDVDMDFADERRDEIIQYIREKYGNEHVAQIGTFGTMAAKGAVRDVARAMGYEYSVADRISKLIPMGAQGFPMTIDRALKEVSELDEIYKKEDDTKKIIDMARKIEGCARHIGVHAAGVVISPDPLTEDVPIQFDPKGEGRLITQYNMHAVGEDGIGLLKFDILGLKNLTMIGNTVMLLKKIYGEEIDVDRIPSDNKKTYEMLTRGETAATFQLNGQGMTRFLKELKPTTIDDINAMIALYRPGPLAFIPDYIDRKNNPDKVKYLDERFEKFLKPTYGILIFQDDVMQLAVNFAGYSWGEADKLRKAMGKKIPEVMAAEKDKFINGCINIGNIPDDKANALWESIETFAAYGFNKGHTASYGRIAYLTSYLKANYPVVYMTAVLMAESGDVDKVSEMVDETKRMRIEVLPPDINESFENFATVGKENKIRFGLSTIKNFGQGVADAVIEERKKDGPFKDLEDFINRVRGKNFNKKSLEALIKSGALDKFGERGEMMANLEEILAYSKELNKESKDQTSLFGESSVTTHLRLHKSDPATQKEKLGWEKELLGLYISGHPLDQFKEKLSKGMPIKEVKEKIKNGFTTIITGHIDDVKVIQTKKGDNMAFVKISDLTDSIETVVFPKTFAEKKDSFEIGKCIAMKGKMSEKNGEMSFILEGVKELE